MEIGQARCEKAAPSELDFRRGHRSLLPDEKESERRDAERRERRDFHENEIALSKVRAQEVFWRIRGCTNNDACSDVVTERRIIESSRIYTVCPVELRERILKPIPTFFSQRKFDWTSTLLAISSPLGALNASIALQVESKQNFY